MGILSFFSKNPEKLEQKGDACFASEDFGSAKIQYEKALTGIEKKSPDNTGLKERVLEKLKQSKEALAQQHVETGDDLVEAGILDTARNLFNLALELTENPETKADLKKRLANLDEGEKAGPVEFSDSDPCETKPGHVSETDEFHLLCATLPEEMEEAYLSYGDPFRKGYLALSRGEFETAAEMLEKAMAEETATDTFIPLELSTALIHLGKAEDARLLLEDFLQSHPASMQGVNLLSDLLCEMELYEKAHALLDSSPDSVKNSLEALLHKGRIYFREGKYQNAASLYQSHLKEKGWSDAVARALAETLEALGQMEEARDMVTALLNRCAGCGGRPDPFDRKKFADLSFELEDFSDKTLELYLSLAKEIPGISSECYDKVSRIYRARGNEAEAQRYDRH